MQPLPPDLVERVERCFSSEAPAILRQLADLKDADGHLFCDRILRCIVYAAFLYPRYSIAYQIRQAQTDYRDLIMGTEYDRKENRVHDFNLPFCEEQFATRNRDGGGGRQ